MVYVTGDTHGRLHRDKLDPHAWAEGRTLTRDDCVLVCGDFGGVFGPPERDEEVLAWWDERPWTTLFLDGNHENHDALDALPTEERFSGTVHVLPGHPHIIHLMRGYVYELPLTSSETASVLVMGGARSQDRANRCEGIDWWGREMPSEEEYDRCTESLAAHDWKVDYVCTHELPCDLRMRALDWRDYAALASGGADRLTNYLQWVLETMDTGSLRCWFCGHYHIDRLVADKVRVLFQDIVALEAKG